MSQLTAPHPCEPYASHAAVTAAAAVHALRAWPELPLVELGVGHYSTPLLRGIARQFGGRVVSYASDAAWAAHFGDVEIVADWDAWRPPEACGLALVDNEQLCVDRWPHLARLAEAAKIVVVHDAVTMAERGLSWVEQRAHFASVGLWPALNTAALSNAIEVGDLAAGEFSSYAPARRVALVCPGPSLVRFPGSGGFDLTIGVNRAAGFAPCDYWVFADQRTPELLAPEGPAGAPILCCDAAVRRRLPRAHAVRPWIDSQWGPRKQPVKWWRYSATTALVLALRLGAAEVVCWGVDQCGEADWDGYRDDAQRRDDERWSDERRVWEETVRMLAGQGVQVRHAIDDPPAAPSPTKQKGRRGRH